MHFSEFPKYASGRSDSPIIQWCDQKKGITFVGFSELDQIGTSDVQHPEECTKQELKYSQVSWITFELSLTSELPMKRILHITSHDAKPNTQNNNQSAKEGIPRFRLFP